MVNAWIMYKSIKGSSIFLLNFRREVAQQALKQCGTPRSRPGPKTSYSESTTNAIRFDRKDHWPVPLPTRYSKCRVCGGRSSVKCEKCDAPLHVQCFKMYHKSLRFTEKQSIVFSCDGNKLLQKIIRVLYFSSL